MAGITALGTTYNLPNYTGILYSLTPTDTPFFSTIGGLSGGGQTSSSEYEWEKFDLRTPAQSTALEGADAPSAQERVRANVTNIVQIQQEQVSVSYSKLAAAGEKSGVNNDKTNPVQNELDWQVEQMLKQMVRDVEFSFLNGRYNKPTDNTTARRTRGLRQAITTNRTNKGTALLTAGLTATASTDKVTATAHGLSNGQAVFLQNVSVAGSGIDDARVYYVVSAATNDFKLALTSGGSAVDITTDCTVDVYTVSASAVPDPDVVGALLQSVYDTGGIMESETATLMVNSTQKRALSKAFANAYRKADPFSASRTVAGVNVQTIETDFGVLNVMLNRFVPQHELIVVSLDVCSPVYREIPGKGHFFAEELAKTGASEKTQLYGEVGLQYGLEIEHGILTGLSLA